MPWTCPPAAARMAGRALFGTAGGLTGAPVLQQLQEWLGGHYLVRLVG